MINENTRQLNEKEALSTSHDTMGGTGEVELQCFKEEIRKLINNPIYTYIP
jgi:hypothetical protein